ncbi:hypothetical protein JOC75_000769 [Metabacillus crassostreae]|uniref:hypothetical protein n=1 Tax=Metabacillus crassostreae TaxID=929098 RepID=UPI00195777FE|nr:hypothetical protein [Metabacillus crassostreae]MBM7602799.1 hypothetical protein [Metabacillus crassostreae]
MKRFTIVIQGQNYELNVGDYYKIHYFDDDTSFQDLTVKIEDTYWKNEDGESMFYIWVPDQKEDYLISDREIKYIKKVNE